MNPVGLAFARAAESFVGTPFRLHGRTPATGLDCVGLVIAALQSLDRNHVEPPTYGLRNLDWTRFRPALKASGFASCSGPAKAGDLLVMRPSAGQFHLVITAEHNGIIHAHSSLGRVVRTPPPFPWPTMDHWRLRDD